MIQYSLEETHPKGTYMKRTIALTLFICLSLLLFACGRGSGIGSPIKSFTFNTIDQSGDAVVGARLSVLEGSRVITTVVTDGEGLAAAELYPGSYTVRIEALPDGYLPVEKEFEFIFSKENPSCNITINNTKPDGSEQKPYIIKDRADIKLGPGKYAFYRAEPTDKTTLVIRNAQGIVASYRGEIYNVNSSGLIIIDIDGDHTVRLYNNGPAVSATAELVYPFGSEKNPHVAKLNNEYKAEVTGREIYYAHTSAADSGITLVGASGGIYTVKNLTTGETLTDKGECEISIFANEGDELLFIISGEGEVSYRFNTFDYAET